MDFFLNQDWVLIFFCFNLAEMFFHTSVSHISSMIFTVSMLDVNTHQDSPHEFLCVMYSMYTVSPTLVPVQWLTTRWRSQSGHRQLTMFAPQFRSWCLLMTEEWELEISTRISLSLLLDPNNSLHTEQTHTSTCNRRLHIFTQWFYVELIQFHRIKSNDFGHFVALTSILNRFTC